MKFSHPGKEIFIKKSVMSALPSETVESRQNVNDAFCSGTPALKTEVSRYLADVLWNTF